MNIRCLFQRHLFIWLIPGWFLGHYHRHCQRLLCIPPWEQNWFPGSDHSFFWQIYEWILSFLSVLPLGQSGACDMICFFTPKEKNLSFFLDINQSEYPPSILPSCNGFTFFPPEYPYIYTFSPVKSVCSVTFSPHHLFLTQFQWIWSVQKRNRQHPITQQETSYFILSKSKDYA